MKSSDVFPSKYLKAADLDEDVEVTIREVILESLETDSGQEHKPVAFFDEGEKGLLLNKTNWNTLAEMFGDESDLWTGKRIVLTVMDVEYKGKMVPAIRVKPQRKPTTGATGSAFPKARTQEPG